MYKSIIKPLLFKMPAERAHHFTFRAFKLLMAIPGAGAIARSRFVVKHPSLERELFGLKFPNPVGLAAGFDKNAMLYNELGNLGFGFIEVGTVTPLAQDGNPQPRLFRLPADEGLINRMGFNNDGLEGMIQRLKGNKGRVLIGGNIGKNKVTPNEEATSDYVKCFDALHPHVDYFVVNVSSPNTPGLRALQDKAPLTQLLATLMERNRALDAPRPMLLKIAPDLTEGQLDDIIAIVADTGIDGVIATNTTISREGLNTPASEVDAMGNGGLSGKPVEDRSTEVIRYLAEKSGKAFPIIGVGGIRNAQTAQAKLDAGADLVQVYTGFIYEGPGMVRRICKGLIG